MDVFLREQSALVSAIKERYQVESNINSEFLGMEQWKIDFIKRQRERQAATPAKAG